MARIYLSDMDGTLLNDNSELSEFSKNKLNDLIKKGVKFTIATARDFHSMKHALEGLEINMPVIECNGSYISDFKTGKKLYINDIKGDIYRIFETLEYLDLPIIAGVYEDEEDYLYVYGNKDKDSYKTLVSYYEISIGDRMKIVDNIRDLLNKRIVFIGSYAPEQEIVQGYDMLKEKEMSNLHIHYIPGIEKGFYFLNISDPLSNKGHAVLEYKKMFLEQEDELYCFGDQYNDIEMIENADTGIAVSNAHNKLKEIADLVIGTNQQDSVVRYIERNEEECI